MEVRDKGVFITGAAMGIGRAVTEALLDRGAKVLFCDINEAEGKKTEQDFQTRYPSTDVIFVRCDVTKGEELKAAFEEAVRRFGAVDVCINNAGIVDESNWELVIAINQVSQIRGSMLALEHMRKDRGGRGGVILNTASTNSFQYGAWKFPVYNATKHAMAAYTTSWANNPDNEEQGVRWGVVCPGACSTALNDWHREGQVYLSMEDRKSRDTSNWMTAKESSEAFLTLLEDIDSNGGMLKVYKKDGQLHQELWMMDKSQHPITSLYMKYSKTRAVEN